MRANQIRYALIGAGMGAETHATELPHVNGAAFEAVYARTAERAEAFRTRYGARKAYSDRAALLADPDIDAVIIVTPNGLHRDFAVAAAQAGKHVIVEKPLEITSARGREIIEACERSGVSLFVIYQMRYAEASAKIKTTIERGDLEAMARRLRRNYCWLFLILLLAWLLKITSAKLQPGAGKEELGFSLPDWFDNAAIGPLPGWLVVAGVGLFYAWLLYVTLRRYEGAGELAYGDVHV